MSGLKIKLDPNLQAKPLGPKSIASPVLPSIDEMAERIKEKGEIEAKELDDILLDTEERAFDISPTLEGKLTNIEKYMGMQNIPIQALKVACDDIMKDLKASPETTLALEPETISEIIQAYIKATDEKTAAILIKQKKKKKPKKPKLNQEAQAALELAKTMDLDDVDF